MGVFNMNEKTDIDEETIIDFVKKQKSKYKKLSNDDLYDAFKEYNITIDGVPFSYELLVEKDFLNLAENSISLEENSISFEEASLASSVLSNIISSPLMQFFQAEQLQSVVNALENLVSKNISITKQEY